MTPAVPPGHIARVSKKPHKVEETAAPYAAKKPAKADASAPARTGERPPDDAAFKKVADKIFIERKELLRKLAR